MFLGSQLWCSKVTPNIYIVYRFTCGLHRGIVHFDNRQLFKTLAWLEELRNSQEGQIIEHIRPRWHFVLCSVSLMMIQLPASFPIDNGRDQVLLVSD